MTEAELQSLGFEQIVEDDSWYYYTMTIGNSTTFVSNASDDVVNDEWYIEMFWDDSIRITQYMEAARLLTILRNGVIQ